MNTNVARVSGNTTTKSIARFAAALVAAAGMTLVVAGSAFAAPGNVVFSGTPADGALTNSRSTSIGISSEGSVEIRCTVDGQGSYSATSSPITLSGLSDGNHYVSCFGVDAEGGFSPGAQAVSWTVDATPPAFAPQLYSFASSSSYGSSDLPSSTASTVAYYQFYPSVYGENNFICSLDGAEYSSCTSPVTLTGLGEGSHTFSVKVVDNAGNIGPAVSNTWTVDYTAPVAPLLSGAPSGLTNSTSASISFTAEADATFTCSVDGGAYGACSSPKSLSGLADGSHSVSVKATDAAGNTSDAATASWTVDATAPAAPGLSGAPAEFTTATDASISFSGEPDATFTCSVDGGSYSSCTSPVSRTGLAEGSYSLAVKQVDTAGNTGPAATASWTVDTTAPNAPGLSGAPSGLTNSTSASISISGEGSATFTCSVDGGSYEACTSPKSLSGLADGNHSVSVKQADRAGNVSTAASTGTWEVDATKPVVALGGVPAGETQGPAAGSYTNGKKPRWYFTSSDAADHLVASSISCQVDSGATLSPCTSPYQVPVNLTDGAHTLKINASDSAGNTRNFTLAFTVDTIAPTVSIADGPSGRSGPSVNFRLTSNETGATFRCRLAGANLVPWGDCDDSNDFTGLVSGSTTAYVQSIDRAGNQSVTASRSWVVDATVPVATIRSRPPVTTGSYPLGITRVDNGEFRFNSNDPLATFECKLDDEAWAACESPYNFSSIVYGDHQFSVRAVNEVGTTGAAATSEWTYAGEPDTTIGSKPEANSHDFSPSVAFSSTYPDATFQCKLDGGSWGTCSSPKSYSFLALLGHTFQVRSVNQLGEPDLTPSSYSWNIVDVPNTAISTAAPAPTFDSAISVAFSSPYSGPSAGYPTAYPGATFQCSLDGGAYSTCTSPKSYTGLTPGSHTVAVRAVNSISEVDPSPASITWTVKEAQTTIATKPAAAITVRDAAFSFTSDASGATFECKLDAGNWSACNTGSKSYTDLVLGSHTFQVRATKNGNTDQTPASWTFDVNTPDTAISAKPAASVLSRDPSFSFNSPNTSSVTFECKLDGGSFGSCASPKRYNDLLPGSHTFQVRACRFGACDVSPASYTWEIRTAETTINAKPSAVTPDRTPSFSFDSDLDSATFQCKLDGGSWGTCTSPKAYSALSIGSHTFSVRALNGGTDAPDPTPATYTWEIRAGETTIGATKPASSTTDRDATISFSSDVAWATFQCRLDGSAWSSCTSGKSYAGPLSIGSHTFEVRSLNGGTDGADQSPASYTWTIVEPETTISSKPSASTTSRQAQFRFTSNADPVTFECKLDSGAWVACTSPKSYTSALAGGAHNFQVRAVTGGNAADPTPASYDWTVVAPDTTITVKPTNPTTNRLPSFSFSSDTTGVTYECKLDGLAWAACTSPKAYSDLLASGDHTFQVRALNGLDLVDATPATYTWTVNCPVLTQSTVLSSTFATLGFGAQVRTMSNGTSQLGNPWGFKLLLSGGTGSDADKLATFGGTYKRVDAVITKNGSSTSITRSLTAGNNWESGFNPTEAGTYGITIKFVNKSGSVTTRTVSITVNPACS